MNAGIVLRAPSGRVLFLLRPTTGCDHPETWCWPGGTAEAGETSEQTARRETREETGLDFTGSLSLIEERDGFTTFLGEVAEEFEPDLNGEHDDAHWTEPGDLRLIAGLGGKSIHPGVMATLAAGLIPERSAMTADAALRRRDHIAFDRATSRTIDPASGHMHVVASNISKATVNPYYGREIPSFDNLGLDPDRVYQVFRPPEELEKAAASFSGKPLLIIHKAMSADDHDREVVVGSIGNVYFAHPYLKADLNIWDGEAIAGVESDQQRELSCGYGYEPVLESGSFEGQPFDLRMKNIGGNHCALVEEGRAGPDVLVGDHQLRRNPVIKTKALPSRKALLVQGALSALLAPKLAADAKIDLGAVLSGVNRANYKAQKANIAKGVGVAVKGHLAQDGDLGEVVETVAELLDNLDTTQSGEADEDDISGMDEESDEDEKEKKSDGAKDEERDCAKDEDKDDDDKSKSEAKDEEPKKDDDKVSKEAMDAALTKARSETRRDTIRQINAISEARRAVHPIVGDLDGDFESAEAVHKFALDAAIEQGIDIDLTGVPASAYGALVKMAARQIASEPKKPTTQTHDAKGAAAAAELIPGLARIKQA